MGKQPEKNKLEEQSPFSSSLEQINALSDRGLTISPFNSVYSGAGPQYIEDAGEGWFKTRAEALKELDLGNTFLLAERLADNQSAWEQTAAAIYNVAPAFVFDTLGAGAAITALLTGQGTEGAMAALDSAEGIKKATSWSVYADPTDISGGDVANFVTNALGMIGGYKVFGLGTAKLIRPLANKSIRPLVNAATKGQYGAKVSDAVAQFGGNAVAAWGFAQYNGKEAHTRLKSELENDYRQKLGVMADTPEGQAALEEYMNSETIKASLDEAYSDAAFWGFVVNAADLGLGISPYLKASKSTRSAASVFNKLDNNTAALKKFSAPRQIGAEFLTEATQETFEALAVEDAVQDELNELNVGRYKTFADVLNKAVFSKEGAKTALLGGLGGALGAGTTMGTANIYERTAKDPTTGASIYKTRKKQEAELLNYINNHFGSEKNIVRVFNDADTYQQYQDLVSEGRLEEAEVIKDKTINKAVTESFINGTTDFLKSQLETDYNKEGSDKAYIEKQFDKIKKYENYYNTQVSKTQSPELAAAKTGLKLEYDRAAKHLADYTTTLNTFKVDVIQKANEWLTTTPFNEQEKAQFNTALNWHLDGKDLNDLAEGVQNQSVLNALEEFANNDIDYVQFVAAKEVVNQTNAYLNLVQGKLKKYDSFTAKDFKEYKESQKERTKKANTVNNAKAKRKTQEAAKEEPASQLSSEAQQSPEDFTPEQEFAAEQNNISKEEVERRNTIFEKNKPIVEATSPKEVFNKLVNSPDTTENPLYKKLQKIAEVNSDIQIKFLEQFEGKFAQANAYFNPQENTIYVHKTKYLESNRNLEEIISEEFLHALYHKAKQNPKQSFEKHLKEFSSLRKKAFNEALKNDLFKEEGSQEFIDSISQIKSLLKALANNNFTNAGFQDVLQQVQALEEPSGTTALSDFIIDVVYPTLNDDEFFAQSLTNSEFQVFLGSGEAETTKGKKSLFDQFIDALADFLATFIKQDLGQQISTEKLKEYLQPSFNLLRTFEAKAQRNKKAAQVVEKATKEAEVPTDLFDVPQEVSVEVTADITEKSPVVEVPKKVEKPEPVSTKISTFDFQDIPVSFNSIFEHREGVTRLRGSEVLNKKRAGVPAIDLYWNLAMTLPVKGTKINLVKVIEDGAVSYSVFVNNETPIGYITGKNAERINEKFPNLDNLDGTINTNNTLATWENEAIVNRPPFKAGETQAKKDYLAKSVPLNTLNTGEEFTIGVGDTNSIKIEFLTQETAPLERNVNARPGIVLRLANGISLYPKIGNINNIDVFSHAPSEFVNTVFKSVESQLTSKDFIDSLSDFKSVFNITAKVADSSYYVTADELNLIFESPTEGRVVYPFSELQQNSNDPAFREAFLNVVSTLPLSFRNSVLVDLESTGVIKVGSKEFNKKDYFDAVTGAMFVAPKMLFTRNGQTIQAVEPPKQVKATETNPKRSGNFSLGLTVFDSANIYFGPEATTTILEAEPTQVNQDAAKKQADALFGEINDLAFSFAKGGVTTTEQLVELNKELQNIYFPVDGMTADFQQVFLDYLFNAYIRILPKYSQGDNAQRSVKENSFNLIKDLVKGFEAGSPFEASSLAYTLENGLVQEAQKSLVSSFIQAFPDSFILLDGDTQDLVEAKNSFFNIINNSFLFKGIDLKSLDEKVYVTSEETLTTTVEDEDLLEDPTEEVVAEESDELFEDGKDGDLSSIESKNEALAFGFDLGKLDLFSKLSKRVKGLLSSIPSVEVNLKTKQINYGLSEYGLIKYEDPKEIFKRVIYYAQGAKSTDEIVANLKATNNSAMVQVAQSIEKLPETERAKFFTGVSQQIVIYRKFNAKEDKTVDSFDTYKTKDTVNQFFEELLALSVEDRAKAYETLKEFSAPLSDIVSAKEDVLNAKLKQASIFLNAIGLKVSYNALTKLDTLYSLRRLALTVNSRVGNKLNQVTEAAFNSPVKLDLDLVNFVRDIAKHEPSLLSQSVFVGKKSLNTVFLSTKLSDYESDFKAVLQNPTEANIRDFADKLVVNIPLRMATQIIGKEAVLLYKNEQFKSALINKIKANWFDGALEGEHITLFENYLKEYAETYHTEISPDYDQLKGGDLEAATIFGAVPNPENLLVKKGSKNPNLSFVTLINNFSDFNITVPFLTLSDATTKPLHRGPSVPFYLEQKLVEGKPSNKISYAAAMPIISGPVLRELERINKTARLASIESDKKVVGYFNGQQSGLEFFLYPFMNDFNTLQEYAKLFYKSNPEVLDKLTSTSVVDKYSQVISAEFINYAQTVDKNFVGKLILHHTAKTEVPVILEFLTNFDYLPTEGQQVSNKFVAFADKLKVPYKDVALLVAINTAVYNNNLILETNDPALTPKKDKTLAENTKRIKQLIAPGSKSDYLIKVDGGYAVNLGDNSGTEAEQLERATKEKVVQAVDQIFSIQDDTDLFNDISKAATDYANLIGETNVEEYVQNNFIAPYSKVEVTDAAEVWTFKRRLQYEVASGNLSYTDAIELLNISQSENPVYSNNVVLSLLKPFFVDTETVALDEQNSYNKVNMVKSAVVTDIPGITTGSLLGTIGKALQENGIDRLVFNSAFKQGQYSKSANVVSNTPLTEQFKSLPVHIFDKRKTVIQQDLTQKKTQISNSTQLMSLLPSQLEGQEGYLEVNKIVSDIIKNNYNNVKDTLYLDLGDGKLAFNDANLAEVLKEQLIADGRNKKHLIDRLAINPETGQFYIPLAAQENLEIQGALTSLITNKIVKFKLPGTGLAVMPSVLIDGAQGVVWLNSERKITDHYLGDDPEVSQIPGLAVPASFFNLNEEDYKKLLNKDPKVEQRVRKMLEEGAEKLVGFRIPNDGATSASAYKIQAILPPAFGEMTFVPKMTNGKYGSDNDGDKLYIIKRGKSITEDADTLLKNALFDFYFNSLSAKKNYARVIKPLTTTYLDQAIEPVRAEKGKTDKKNLAPSFGWSNQTKVYQSAKLAKSGVGFFAALNSFFFSFQNSIYGKKAAIYKSEKVEGQWEVNQNIIIDFKTPGINPKRITDIKDLNKLKKFLGNVYVPGHVSLPELMNAAVDDVKNQQLSDLEVNDNALPLFTVGCMLGLHPIIITNILRTPTVKEYLSVVSSSSPEEFEEKHIAKLEQKYKLSKGSLIAPDQNENFVIDASFEHKTIEELTNKYLINNFIVMQYLLRAASKISNFNTNISLYRKGSGKNLGEALLKQKKNLSHNLPQNDLFIKSSYKYGLEPLMTAFDFNPINKNFKQELLDRNSPQDIVSLSKATTKTYFSQLAQSQPYFKTNEILKETVDKFASLFKEVKYSLGFRSNYLLNHIEYYPSSAVEHYQVEPANIVSLIKGKLSTSDHIFAGKKAFLELYNSPEPKAKELAELIIELSLHKGFLAYGDFNLAPIIPINALKDYSKNTSIDSARQRALIQKRFLIEAPKQETLKLRPNQFKVESTENNIPVVIRLTEYTTLPKVVFVESEVNFKTSSGLIDKKASWLPYLKGDSTGTYVLADDPRLLDTANDIQEPINGPYAQYFKPKNSLLDIIKENNIDENSNQTDELPFSFAKKAKERADSTKTVYEKISENYKNIVHFLNRDPKVNAAKIKEVEERIAKLKTTKDQNFNYLLSKANDDLNEIVLALGNVEQNNSASLAYAKTVLRSYEVLLNASPFADKDTEHDPELLQTRDIFIGRFARVSAEVEKALEQKVLNMFSDFGFNEQAQNAAFAVRPDFKNFIGSTYLPLATSKDPIGQLTNRMIQLQKTKAKAEFVTKSSEFKQVIKEYKEIFGNDYSQFFEKNSDGNFTGNLVSEYSPEFYSQLDNLFAVYDKAVGDKKKAAAKAINNFYNTQTDLQDPSVEDSKANALYNKFLVELETRSRFVEARKAEGASEEEIKELQNNLWAFQQNNDPKKFFDEFQERKDNPYFIGWKYINRKPKESFKNPQFEKIQGNEIASNFYNFYRDLLIEGRKALGGFEVNGRKVSYYYIPDMQVAGLKEAVQGGFDSIVGYLKDSVTNAVLDKGALSKNYYIDPKTKLPIAALPVTMITGRKGFENRSTDLEHIGLSFLAASVDYKLKKEIDPKLRNIAEVYLNQKYYKKSGRTTEVIEQMTYDVPEAGRLIDTIRDFLYGDTKTTIANFGKVDPETLVGKKVYTAEERQKINMLVTGGLTSAEFDDVVSKLNILDFKLSQEDRQRRLAFNTSKNGLEYLMTNAEDKDLTPLLQKYNEIEAKLEQLYKTSTGDKFLQLLNNFTAKAGLGFNFPSAVRDLTVGMITNYIEGETKYYKASDALWAQQKAMKGIFGMYSEKDKVISKFFAQENDDLSKARNRVLKTLDPGIAERFSTDVLFTFHRRGNIGVTHPIFFALLKGAKTTNSEGQEITFYDAIGANGEWLGKPEDNVLPFRDENGELVIPENYFNFVMKANSLVAELAGNYNPDEYKRFKKNAIFQSLLVFRNWMPATVERRWGSMRPDPSDPNQFTRGRYRSIFFEQEEGYFTSEKFSVSRSLEALKAMGVNLIMLQGQKYNTDRFTDNDIRNFKANVKELRVGVVMLGAMLVLSAAAANLDSDDEDDAAELAAINFTLNLLRKADRELTFYYSYSSAKELLENPFMFMGTLDRVEDAFMKHPKKYIENKLTKTPEELEKIAADDRKKSIGEKVIGFIPVLNQYQIFKKALEEPKDK